ncbi:MAG: FAD-dependent oxidoreductase [Candidatus Parvarchaeota archaeon]|nr:FAD-dependent oxidoreductase [Candidatus Jingweiarchaeum tengchongense]MCW1300087.1 FAD-dependent oxidoreductase [Candidatus Jingweiarchaeum tengchongense]MCW1304441.1 FAD-dependent oxidoreductase [Candidatus Jingweiarchaeum tengchongense]MCW1305608.1 FAD-dependent oxidoreductase [Candidatus Jingweiarchaeum tengchongense]MCW1310989.1 FAD-dependent oxidoreductase [Candidatus Jingweiarchaeum tengchongense]
MRVCIIGAGPAGLFAAHELSKNKNIEVIILEKGNDVKDRTQNVFYGIGGAGLFSDGKLIFSPMVGGNLYEFMHDDEARKLLDYIKEIFLENGVENEDLNNKRMEDELERRSIKAGIKFIPTDQLHIGSDCLPKVIESIKTKLEKNGVKFLINCEATDLVINKERYVSYKRNGKNEKINFDKLIIACGRSNSNWLEKISEKLGIKKKFNPVDVGVRVEVPAKVMEEVTSVNWDPKFHIRTPTYDDFVRTFCTSPYGYVIKEEYEKYVLVNGHSRKDIRTQNTNFAFLVQVNLTQPVENTHAYGESIAKLTTTIGGGKPLIQRLVDLRSGKRSTWERIKRSNVSPTLLDATPGDISMALPHRIVTDIVEGLDKLDRVIPGVSDDSTILYAPEIKFYAMRVITDKNLETNIKNVYVAGDGAGVSRGIVGAAATGIIAARGIMNSI